MRGLCIIMSAFSSTVMVFVSSIVLNVIFRSLCGSVAGRQIKPPYVFFSKVVRPRFLVWPSLSV